MGPREFRHPLFVAGAGLYALVASHRLGLVGHLPPLVTAYAADLVCLPLVLTTALAGLRAWYFRSARFVLPASWVLGTWLAFAGWFELLLPRLRPTATADPADVLAYALGGLVFYRWLNRPGGPPAGPSAS